MIGSKRMGMDSVLTAAEVKPEKTPMEEYVQHLGTLLANLHSLEFWLRVYLFKAEGHKPGFNLKAAAVGEKVPVNSMTDYASLKDLIRRFNSKAGSGVTLREKEIVTLRDSLAHGRLDATTQKPPFRLVTFAKPKDSFAEVTGVESLDLGWLEEKRKVVRSAVVTVGTMLALDLVSKLAK